MPRYVAFLRAINAGGKRKVPMRELLPLMAALGCVQPRSYLQSGNIVFEAPASQAKKLDPKIEQAIEDNFGFAVPVTLRSAAEIDRVVQSSPHVAQHPHDRLFVAFLKHAPACGVEALHPKCAPGDALHLAGRDLYCFLPGGIADTKLTNVFLDKQLGTVTTLRNWNTVLAVHGLLHE